MSLWDFLKSEIFSLEEDTYFSYVFWLKVLLAWWIEWEKWLLTRVHFKQKKFWHFKKSHISWNRNLFHNFTRSIPAGRKVLNHCIHQAYLAYVNVCITLLSINKSLKSRLLVSMLWALIFECLCIAAAIEYNIEMYSKTEKNQRGWLLSHVFEIDL